MPPKPKASAAVPSKKTEQKKKDKIIEDKTFGLKNKKGAKNQKFIQQVQNQVKFGQQSARKLEEQKKVDAGKKKDDKKAEQEINSLFKPVTSQKVEKGADPKSVLCAFFKQGQCGKGDRCKFSHDLTIERKSEKRSAYVDLRDDGENMENWDEEKLKEVIEKKHAEADMKMPKTDIICRYFLDALERSKYGWFWECPNSEKCIYRHALPPGFVLNKDKKKEDKKEEISIEDLVEKERANLGHVVTKVTLETFLAWKKRKQKEKEDVAKKEEARKKAEFKSGKSIGLSGREMFTFRPEMAIEDLLDENEMTMDTSNLPRCDDDDVDDDSESSGYVNGEQGFNTLDARELTLEALASQLQEVDCSGTISVRQQMLNDISNHVEESNKLAEAAGGGDDEDASTSFAPSPEEIPIDEDLFAEDDEDLDELEENLDNMMDTVA